MNIDVLEQYAPGPCTQFIPQHLQSHLLKGAQAQFISFRTGCQLSQKVSVCPATELYIWIHEFWLEQPELHVQVCATASRIGLHYLTDGQARAELPPFDRLSISSDHYSIYRIPRQRPLAAMLKGSYIRSVFITYSLETLARFARLYPGLKTGVDELGQEDPEGMYLAPALLSRSTRQLLDRAFLRPQESPIIDHRAYYKHNALLLPQCYMADRARAKGPVATQAQNHHIVKSVTRHIQQHYQDALSVHSLSERFYILPCRLNRLFKSSTGKTLHQYYTGLRLSKAEESLRNSNDDIARIALDSGFRNADSLSKAFKQKWKISPMAYRLQQESLR